MSLEELFKQLVEKYKDGTAGSAGVAPYMHGPGGLFAVAGSERNVISTRVMPRSIADIIPARGTIVTNPLFPYITGFLDTSGSNPATPCADPKTAGPMKNCYQTAQFGRYSLQTRTLELNRVGQQYNRGEFLDLNLVNPPLLEGINMMTPNVPGNPDLMREVLVRFMELGVAFQNMLIPQVWTGNPANNNAGGGYKEFPGLDLLVGTTKVDALTGTPCPSLRSDIKDFAYTKVTDNGGYTIYRILSYMMRYLRKLAEDTNMIPVRWVFAMRDSLFWELSAIWPCIYQTFICGYNKGNSDYNINVDAGDQIRMRDDMRANRYLLIDGVRFDVITDSGITEEDTGDSAKIDNGCYASDIYVLPMTVAGNYSSLYWEYLDYSQGAMIGVNDGTMPPGEFWTDGGKFFWHFKTPVNWCVQWLAKIEPRIILHTPHLAGRVTDVQYCPLQHEREPLPTDNYFVDGGVQNRSQPTLYSDWNSSTPSR